MRRNPLRSSMRLEKPRLLNKKRKVDRQPQEVKSEGTPRRRVDNCPTPQHAQIQSCMAGGRSVVKKFTPHL
eukprot:CAMPEP_0203854148 /NCGR_PEP_ID=MMETSP0359-20131031/8941_1 /ASSEMBLY_ACC=CAM_ASM_000338 /TAXON_ID=268821 /ORGANISM="Scrippsiella Hangoei, Strain SHTV-5" /LENGTH=70 /DNA_ID=CAMNT_0050770601 /DNA_START=31 /DNA_END=239 /DNA_ORIENTATION=-